MFLALRRVFHTWDLKFLLCDYLIVVLPLIGSSPTWPTKERATSAWKPPNIISIAQKQRECLFSFYQKSILFSYGTSHLENLSNRMYYEDTKKE